MILVSCEDNQHLEADVIESSITNGVKQTNEEFPWFVKIDLCAGVILNSQYVLTVAHCVYDKPASLITLRALIDGKLTSIGKVSRVILHHNYVPWKDSLIKYNDIALLQLKDNIVLGEHLQAAQLPGKFNEIYERQTSQFILGGYGRLEDGKYPKQLNYIKGVELLGKASSWKDENDLLVSDDLDQDFVNTYLTGQYLGVKVQDGRSACRGDSGAPLVSENATVYGLVSHGQNNCEGQPAFFLTKVSYYIDWIKQNMVSVDND